MQTFQPSFYSQTKHYQFASTIPLQALNLSTNQYSAGLDFSWTTENCLGKWSFFKHYYQTAPCMMACNINIPCVGSKMCPQHAPPHMGGGGCTQVCSNHLVHAVKSPSCTQARTDKVQQSHEKRCPGFYRWWITGAYRTGFLWCSVVHIHYMVLVCLRVWCSG